MNHSKTPYGYVWIPLPGQPNTLVDASETALQVEYLCPSKDHSSTDFYIRCGEYEFRVHRGILWKLPKLRWDFHHAYMTRLLPPVIDQNLINGLCKLTLELNEYDPQTVRRVLQFCYTGELQLGDVIPSTDEVLVEQKRLNNPTRLAYLRMGMPVPGEENEAPDQNMQPGRQSEHTFELRVGNSAVHLLVGKKSPEELQKFKPTTFSKGDLTTLAKTFLFAIATSSEELFLATIRKYENILGSVPDTLNSELNSEVWMESLTMMNKAVFPRLSIQCSFCKRWGHLEDMCFKNAASTSHKSH